MTFRKRLYAFVDEDSRTGNFFNTLIILLITLNMIAIILESVKSLREQYDHLFEAFESFCLVVFTIEYIIRVLTADFVFLEYKGWRPFVKYVFSFMALIDLLSILPSLLLILLPQGVLAEMQFIRMLRIMRIFRVLKITRYSNSLRMMGDVLKEKSGDLSITIFVAMILMVIASTLMYYAEHSAQPDQFPDIVHAFWWAIATLTTVGYGDVYPVTGVGKILSGSIALLGIGLVALPTGILSSAFVDRMEDARRKKKEEKNTGTVGKGPTAIDPKDTTSSKVAEPTVQEERNGGGKAESAIADKLGVILPECPHPTLLSNGDFPAWMSYCPMCGENIEQEA